MILLLATVDSAEILTICVMPSRRRCGIGRKLLRAAARRLASEGVARLFLEVAEDNLAARALYVGHGLVEVGRRAGYYRPVGGGATAALVLVCDVPALCAGGDIGSDSAADRSGSIDIASR